MSGNESDKFAEAEPSQEAQEIRLAAMDRASEQNRIQKEAGMLPSTKLALSKQQIAEARERISAYLTGNNISLKTASKGMKYSPGAISSFLNGTYIADGSDIARAGNTWIERDARRREARLPVDYVKTWVAEDIHTTICLADKHNTMAVIVAPAGTGKTKILKICAEQMRGIYLCCTVNTTLRGLFLLLARELGWERKSGSTYELERFIVEKLLGTGRIIFVDEAHLMGASIRSIRSIHDQAEVPIILVGTDEIETAVDDRAHGRGQFSSRTIFYSALDYCYNAEGAPGRSNTKTLFTIEELEEFFAKRKIRLDRDAFRMAWGLACLPGFGSLRLIERIVSIAISGANSLTDHHLSKDDLLEALSLVERKRFDYLNTLVGKHLRHWDSAPSISAAVA